MRKKQVNRFGLSNRTRLSMHGSQGLHLFLVMQLSVVMVLLAQSPGAAVSGPTAITSVDDAYDPFGLPGQEWNGQKVYLSSPRHSNSGNRGECFNPGREENVNGRYWNHFAANSNYYNDSVTTSTSEFRNLRSRGYKVTVGANARDDGFLMNQEASNNWGANVHLVTHTNSVNQILIEGALQACSIPLAIRNVPTPFTQALVVLYRPGDTDSETFRDRLLPRLDPVLPGVSRAEGRLDLEEIGPDTNAFTKPGST